VRRYDPGMLEHVPTLSEIEREEGALRRLRLLAALEITGASQSDVARKMNLAGERTAVTTVNRWCRGKAVMSEATLRYVLTVLGLPADWQPPESH
jgi:transcriptional regulator with XRE-family HTH domain